MSAANDASTLDQELYVACEFLEIEHGGDSRAVFPACRGRAPDGTEVDAIVCAMSSTILEDGGFKWVNPRLADLARSIGELDPWLLVLVDDSGGYVVRLSDLIGPAVA